MNLYQFIIVVENYKLIRENVYNVDKKRFMIGIKIIFAWVRIYKELTISEMTKTSQNSSKKWILLSIIIYVI